MILALIQNLALLASLSVGLQMLSRRLEQRPALLALITGVLFGAVGVVAMMTPLRFAPGVIYDGRSIILSLAGVFGGPVTAGVAAVMSAAYRIHLGGAGAAAGVATILESAVLGVVLHYLRRRNEVWVNLVPLWGFALVVHLLMLLAQLLVPGRGWEAILRVGPTVLVCYPLCFLLIAQVFLDGERRRKTVEALHRSEARHRAFFEQGPDGVVVLDPKTGAVLEFNEQVCRQLGYSRAEFARLSLADIEARETPDETRATIAQVLRSGRLDFETLQRTKSGEIRNVLVTAQVIEANRHPIYHCIWRDITDRRRMEEQLRQAQRMEAVGQLAGGVAHDFNNILAAILMQLGLLQERAGLDSETQEALRELQRGAERAAALTRQLLIFSRRSVLDVKRLDLDALVENLLKMLRRLIGEHIQLRFVSKALAPIVEADAGMLEQVLVNLVVNARDAMPKGGLLQISTGYLDLDAASAQTHPQGSAGRFVCLSVQDTGSGIPPSMLQKIFEPFFTTKELGKGTGLGLATVHGIVAQHRGWVEVESEVGKGSTFHVFLPAAKTGQPAARNDWVLPPATPRGCETLLLVEDEEAVRRQLSRCLRSFGYTVLEAANGKDALRIWEETHLNIQLLLTDMVMPEGLTGLDLAREFRAKKPGLKVIISSGYSPESIPSGQANGEQVTFLAKPYQPSTLAALVRSCLDQKS